MNQGKTKTARHAAHQALGCEGCKYSIRRAIRMGGQCCTCPEKVEVFKNGRCKNRKAREVAILPFPWEVKNERDIGGER